MNSAIFYRGPSVIDGDPIVGIISGLKGTSANRKTGAMAQTWILRADMAPTEAIRSGADASICGDCRHRRDPATGVRTCYVNVGQAPQSVWRTIPNLPQYDGRTLGYPLRLGAYGDPLAIPLDAWRPLLDASADVGRTGYTHRWHTIGRATPEWRDYVMASCDTAAESMLARALGWRTFRVRVRGSAETLENEILCLSESHGRSCAQCRLCNGAHPTAPSIRIDAHGASAARFGR